MTGQLSFKEKCVWQKTCFEKRGVTILTLQSPCNVGSPLYPRNQVSLQYRWLFITVTNYYFPCNSGPTLQRGCHRGPYLYAAETIIKMYMHIIRPNKINLCFSGTSLTCLNCPHIKVYFNKKV